MFFKGCETYHLFLRNGFKFPLIFARMSKSVKPVKKSVWVNLVLVLITLMICFLLLEICIRWFYPQLNMNTHNGEIGIMYKPNWHGGYTTKEFSTDIRINSQGFRDIEFVHDEYPTVLFIGDSFTAALEVSLNDTFHKRLNTSIEDTKFYALGHGGYDVSKMYLLYLNYVPELDPDVVVLLFFPHNDVLDTHYNRLEPTITYRENQLTINYNTEIFFLGLKRYIESKSQAVYFIESTIYKAVKSTSRQETLNAYELYLRNDKPYMDDAWEKTAALFWAMQRRAIQEDRKLYIVRIPLKEELNDALAEELAIQLDVDNLNLSVSGERFSQMCSTYHFSCLDLADYFKNQSDLYFEENAHWNARGHEQVALALYNLIW